jgi:hypothetical protein
VVAHLQRAEGMAERQPLFRFNNNHNNSEKSCLAFSVNSLAKVKIKKSQFAARKQLRNLAIAYPPDSVISQRL